MVAQKIKHRARLVFADNLRIIRVQNGFSQEALAAKAGLHRTYVGSTERGERNISIDNMEKIAKALGVSLVVLLQEIANEPA